MEDAFRVVDLPGYGFAFAKTEKIDSWHKLVVDAILRLTAQTEEYLLTRKCLRRLYVLLGRTQLYGADYIDSRHGLKYIDKCFLELLDKLLCVMEFNIYM